MTVIIGLTGGIASGKSTVSAMLREFGIPVIDADVIAREVVKPGKTAYNSIVEAFGQGVLLENGEINRQELGGIVFHNEEKRLLLNRIVHPAVRAEMHTKKEAYVKQDEQAVVLDIPLLFESKLTSLVERVLLVYVDEDVQLQRLMQRNHLTEEEAKARIRAQIPLVEKLAMADEIINNNGTIEQTKTQLMSTLEKWSLKL